MMLALFLDPIASRSLALEEGEYPEDLHITLAFLGDSIDLPPSAKNPVEHPFEIRQICAELAKKTLPMVGRVQGIGRFTPSDGPHPVYAAPTVIGLNAFRAELVQRLTDAGYYVAQDYDFTPHITLDYLDPDDETPEIETDVLLNFDLLWLVVGEKRIPFELGGDTAPQAVSEPDINRARSLEYRQWRDRAIKDAKEGRAVRPFVARYIPQERHAAISGALSFCRTVEEVKQVFVRAKETEAIAA